MSNKPTLTSKGRYKIEFRGTECLNCGHPLKLTDKFCSNCSQANSTKKLSLKDFFDEFFATLISYDSKLLKTLSAMLIQPGKITRDFINGKRASYTNPFRFLLSLTIIYFLMINYGGNYSSLDKHGLQNKDEIFDRMNDFNFDSNQFENEDFTTEELDTIIDIENIKLSLKETANKTKSKDSVILANPSAYFKTIGDKSFIARQNKKQDFFRTVITKDTIYDFEQAVEKYDISNTFENNLTFNLAHGTIGLLQQPGSFISSMISKLPFAIFFFLPAFALFIWLVYIRKKYSYTDHLIFSFHNTSLFFILLIISYLIEWITNFNVNWVFLILFCFYLFISMKRFYQQSFIKTSIKYVFLNTIFFILAMFSMAILFAGNIFTF
ncbi:DUF3667 domain-containing protein [Aurantibacter sp.]|uniref:DUF3667 domain-containing protein n=1 Tax=Aurantibacter sp. TaxID=2807103 RepID=UPI003266D415